jgi:hypothetical protein
MCKWYRAGGQTFSVKAQVVNILSFVTASQLYVLVTQKPPEGMA